MESKRQLAAIMFTDIVGYTALMGADEDAALNQFRSQLAAIQGVKPAALYITKRTKGSVRHRHPKYGIS